MTASLSALVSFVGAGPGDPELITVRALRRIRAADVVLHDRLIARELLHEARAGARILDVGKAPGRPCRPQAAVNALIVDCARPGQRVVRLKGGDPSLFGRLAEEIAAVEAAGIAYEIVPGVTAATAAASLAGVSLTQRHPAESGAASMVILATGTDHTGLPSATLNGSVLAQAGATLVFYMGVRGIESITRALTSRGRPAAEPALVVERMGSIHERVLAGDLGSIAATARAEGVEPPAVLIVGPTARPGDWRARGPRGEPFGAATPGGS